MQQRFAISAHHDVLNSLGLRDLESIRTWSDDPIKQQRGRRDVCRICSADHHTILYLKRNLRPYRKHALASMLRHGRYVSTAEVEATSLDRIRELGVSTPRCIATGATFGVLGETFSFLIMESAPGIPLDDWLANRPDPAQVRQVSQRLVQQLQRVHAAGIGLPTLLGRHIFVADAATDPQLTMIDVDRLVEPRSMDNQRTRDLAQLHISIPLAHLDLRQRVRFLRQYTRGDREEARRLLRAIARRSNYLLLRRRRRAAEFVAGLAASRRERIFQVARRAQQGLRAAAWTAEAAVASSGIALLWLAYALARRDLLPLDEAHEWEALADHLDDAAPTLHLADWLLSTPGIFGLVLVLISLVVARRVLLQR